MGDESKGMGFTRIDETTVRGEEEEEDRNIESKRFV